MKIQQYKKNKKNVTAFYHEDFKWKVVLPTIIYNNLIEKIEQHPPFKEFKLSIALYYLSLIISIPATHKDKIYQDGYIPLDSRLLQKKYCNYKKYFEYFSQIKIIETKNYSTFLNRCKSYRYNFSALKYDGTECVDFQTFEITDTKFNKKILDENICNDSSVSCQHLCKWFNDKLRIDFEGLIDNLQSKFCHEGYSLAYDKFNSIITKAYNYWFSALTLRDQVFRASRRPQSDNRLHTNLTNMPAIFRPFIKYNFEEIASLDIKNSQPYFMVLLLERYKYDKEIRKIMRYIYGKGMGIMLKVLEETTSCKEFQEEFSKIKRSILSGTFYEYLGDVFEYIKPIQTLYNSSGEKIEVYKSKFYNSNIKKIENLTFMDKRDLMKKLTLQILYTPLKKPSKEYIFFKQKFPLVCECIEIFKTNSYKDFPKLLQHIEANCILDVLTDKVNALYPEMPLWTIHDSICTTVGYFSTLKQTVEEMFLNYSGSIVPSFKVEYWNSEKNILNNV